MDKKIYIFILAFIVILIASIAIINNKKDSVINEEVIDYSRKENVIVEENGDKYDVIDPDTKEKITTVNSKDEVQIYNDDLTYNPMPIGFDE